jgi:hypothetical protein
VRGRHEFYAYLDRGVHCCRCGTAEGSAKTSAHPERRAQLNRRPFERCSWTRVMTFKLWQLAILDGLLSGTLAAVAFNVALGSVFAVVLPAMILVAARDTQRPTRRHERE